jgi:hypothetical protein
MTAPSASVMTAPQARRPGTGRSAPPAAREKVNHLVAEDRDDLIPEAVAAYADEALRAITAGKAAGAGPARVSPATPTGTAAWDRLVGSQGGDRACHRN